jgi:probable HAF family extracellular repeat protein
MIPRPIRQLAPALLLTILPLVPLATSPAIAAGPPTYQVTDLGTLGGSFSLPTDINDRGQVVGEATLPGDTTYRAFRWQNGVMTDLGTLGGPNSFANGIDATGQVAGGADTATASNDPYCFAPPDGSACHAFLLRNGVKVDLGTFGGANSEAAGLNDRQQVVGQAETGVIDPATGYSYAHAYLWQRGALTDLGTVGDGQYSGANSINDAGQVVGTSTISTVPNPLLVLPNYHAALWQNGTAADLGTLGGDGSIAFQVNQRGQIVGFSFLADDVDFHAFLWQNGTMTDLGTVAGDTASQAYGISDRGQIVGSSGTTSALVHAFLWQAGVMTDLNTRIPSDSGWQLQVAYKLNARGQIVGVGIINGQPHGFLLTPTAGQSIDPTASAGSASTAASQSGAQPHSPIQWRMPRWGRSGAVRAASR